jgi:hypothetical protein
MGETTIRHPHGKWMYFSADTGDGFHLWRQRYPNGSPEQITFGPTEEEGIAVAPDGRSLVTSAGIRQFSVGTSKISGYPGERELQFGAVLLKHVPLAHSTTPTDATMTPVKLAPGSKGTAAPL